MRIRRALGAVVVAAVTVAVAQAVATAEAPRVPRNGKLLISRGDSAAERTLYTIDARGRHLHLVRRGLIGSWSPDGRRLAVLAVENGLAKLWISDSRRRGEWRLLLPWSRRQERAASWSSDDRLAITRSRKPVARRAGVVELDNSPFDVWTVRADGAGLRRLAGGSRPSFDTLSLSWSHDAERIVFVAARAGRRFAGRHVDEKLFVMNGDGTDVRRVTVADAFVTSQAWSPDDRQIVFLERRKGIALMNADGSGRRALTHDGTDFGPVWSPDGTKIAFTRTGGNDVPYVYVMAADGSSPRRIAQGVVRAWQPVR